MLLYITDFFNISVLRLDNKKVVKAVLYEALVAQQVLPERDVLLGVAHLPILAFVAAEAVPEVGGGLGAYLDHEWPVASSVDPGWQLVLKVLEL